MSTREMAIEEELARVRLGGPTLRRLLAYLRPHRAAMTLALSIEAVWVVSMLVDPWILQRAVDGPLPRLDVSGTLRHAAALAANVVFRAAITVVELRITNRVGIAVLHAIRRDVFDHLQRLSMRYFDRTRQGRILARADRDVESLEHLVTWGPVVITSLGSSLLLGFVRLAWAHPFLLAWVSGAVPVLFVLTRVFERYGFPAYRRVRETHSAISSHVAESITGVRVIQAFAAADREDARLADLQRDYRAAVLRGARVASGFVPTLTVAIHGILIAALLLGGAQVLEGRLTVGGLLESVMLLSFVLGPVEGLGSLYNESLVAGASAERIFLLLDTVPEVRDAPGAADVGRLTGAVEFEHVSFAYDPGGEAGRQVHDVSFRVAPGERVALVGKTGAGKTSILSLLARFYEPQEGRILLDGRDAKTITGASLHAQMGIVLQENYLFGGSVLENLRFVRPGLTEEGARQGFSALGCAEVLDSLSGGLATDVGERGANLSEGERQVVCFVRAFLADPSILLLDEATSAVDTRTEALILRALDALSAKRTTFVIAHRLSTVRHADRILVMDGGRLVEQGTHDELLAQDGVYAALYAEYAH